MPDELVEPFAAQYLRAISSRLGLDRTRAEDITKELATHLEESIQDHRKRGLAKGEADRKAVEALGDPNKVSRQLKWVHGFGRYTDSPTLDAFLGCLPFGLGLLGMWLQASMPEMVYLPYYLVFWSTVIGVSNYALKEAVPAWTVTWLGLAHLLVLCFVFNGTFGCLKFLLGQPWALSYATAFGLTSTVLFITTLWLARKRVDLTLLLLLPLSVLYVTAGYEEAAPFHRLGMASVVLIFCILFAFAYLLTHVQRLVLFAAIGFAFYTALYFDILRTTAPPPLNSTGITMVGIWILIYAVPITLVSSPVYLYLKRRTSCR